MELRLEEKTQTDPTRELSLAKSGDTDKLGMLAQLPGKWINAKEGLATGLEGRGWNMIALPFMDAGAIPPGDPRLDYRVLANQYNETLDFTIVDGPVKNRGVEKEDGAPASAQTDQTIDALDYQQMIAQIAVGDSPATSTDVRGAPGAGIHHEPGFMLHIHDQQAFIDYEVETPQGKEPVTSLPLSIARLATIPHGDSVTAMGVAYHRDGPPKVPEISGLPVQFQPAPGAEPPALENYLKPYAALSAPTPFEGIFDVSQPWQLLAAGIAGVHASNTIECTTTLHFDTRFGTGGIVNTPFVVKEANAAEMEAYFYIMKLKTPINGRSWLLAYIQNVALDFFPARGSATELIRWPHVSINMMCRDEIPKIDAVEMPHCTHPHGND